MKKLLLMPALFTVLLLAACDAPIPPKFEPIRYAGASDIRLNVANMQIYSDYVSPKQPPHIEHMMKLSPERAIREWMHDRIKTTGARRSLAVMIKDARMTSVRLPTRGGIAGLFQDDQQERVQGNIWIELRVYGEQEALSLASTEVRATRSITLPESMNVLEKEAARHALLADIMKDINAELEKNIQQYFANYIDYRP